MQKHLILSAVAATALITGCASTSSPDANSATMTKPVAEAPMSDTKVGDAKMDKAKDVGADRKGLTQTFSATPEEVKTATLVAMKKIGFTIKKDEGMMIEGKRSNKVGLMVGSGGEKMKSEIIPLEGGMTAVNVRTKKTFVGIAGQKNWDDEVMELIAEALNG